MKKSIRATDIVARFIEARPDYESYSEFSRRAGLTTVLTPTVLNRRGDIGVGLLYKVAKAFGYQVIIFNPNPPKGMEKAYVVGEAKAPITPREKTDKVHISRDPYNGQLFKATRKYKRKRTKFTRIR